MTEKECALTEIKTLLRVLNTWGNVLVPSLDDEKETTAKMRLCHFVGRAKNEFGMTLDEIEDAIA